MPKQNAPITTSRTDSDDVDGLVASLASIIAQSPDGAYRTVVLACVKQDGSTTVHAHGSPAECAGISVVAAGEIHRARRRDDDVDGGEG